MKHVEIEIKFEIPFELIALFIDWVTPLAKSSATHAHLENHYFDTKQHDFKKIGVGLRTRMRNGEKCVQTLKWHSDTHLGNLNQFHELTEALTEPVPDLKAFSQEDLPEHVAKNIDTFVVEEQFRTDFNRQYWQVVHNNTHIKVTLDQGKVTCPDTGHAPHILREVELELQQGDIKDLISFAQEFIQLGSMRLGYHTKAAWGDRVYHNYPKPEIHRLPWAPLHAELPLSEAITRIFSSALKHSQYHTQCFFDAPSLSALMQVRNGFAMIHQAVLLFSPRPLAPNNLTWIEKLIQTEHHLSWLGLANAQKRWCRADGYKQQRWPHSDILTKFMAHMKSPWPEAYATQAWMQSTEYLDMQLTLTQWIASLTNNLKRETKEPLLSYAQKKLDSHWMHLTTTSWQEKNHQSGLLKMTGPLRRGLIISLCFGGIFSHASARNQFQQAWLDVLQGLEDLHWLETLETSLHKMTPEPSIQADLRVWLQSRQTLLVEVLENSYQNACEQAWYWHEV